MHRKKVVASKSFGATFFVGSKLRARGGRAPGGVCACTERAMRHQFDDDGLPVGVNPKGGATDVKTRPLQSPFSNVFDFEEASGMAGTGSEH